MLRGGGTRRRRVPAATRGENSPEMAEIGHPGVESTGFWVGKTPRIMRDPLGRFPGFGEALLGLATARGGAGWWCSPASGVVRAGLCYGLRYLAQKNQEADEVLTGLGNEGKTGWRRAPAASRGRRSVAGHCGGVPSVWTPWFDSRKGCDGEAGVRVVQRSPAAWKLRRQSHLPAMRPWRNSRCGVTRSGAKELEDDPGIEVEPVRPLDGAQVRRSCDSTAAQRSGCPAEQDARRARVTVAAADGRRRGGSGPYL